MIKRLVLFLIISLSTTPVLAAQKIITIYGRVSEEISGKPVEYVRVIVEPKTPTAPVPVSVPAPDVSLVSGTTNMISKAALLPGTTATLSVAVSVPEKPLEVLTDLNGKYEVKIPAGAYTLTFKKREYTKQVREIDMSRGKKRLNVNILSTAMFIGEEVVVTAREPVYKKPSVSKEVLSSDEIKKLSGPKEDVFEAIKMLPGIAVANDYSAEFAIRGGDPDEVGVFLDNSWVASPFHMESSGENLSSGIMTVFNNEMIDNVTLYTGGFPARYGNAMSGIIDIDTKEAGKGKLEGKFSISLIDAKFYLNCPIVKDRLGITIAGRRNYIDLLLGLLAGGGDDKATVEGVGEVDIGSVDFVFPYFWDLHFKVDYSDDNNDELSFYYLPTKNYSYLDFEGTVTYDDDDLRFPGESSDYTMDFIWDTSGSLAYLNWKHEFSEKLSSISKITYNVKSYLADMTMTSTVPDINFTTGQNVGVRHLELKEELVYKPSEAHTISLGIEAKPSIVSLDITDSDLSVDYDDGTGDYTILVDTFTTNYLLRTYYVAGHIQDRWKIADRLYADLGVRYDYLQWNDNAMVSPRLGISYGITEKMIARFAWGYFYQHPSIVDFIPDYGGNTDLEAMRAEHKILSLEAELPHNTKVKLEGFLKDYTSLIADDPDNLVDPVENIYNKVNTGDGYARGIEFMVKNQLSKKFSGWISYTLSSSRKKEGNKDYYYDFNYDRTHIFTISTNFEPARRVNIGLTWKWFTGKPYTPRVKDELNGVIWGYNSLEKNSARMPPYRRLDVRISKDYVYRKWTMTLYTEVFNVLDYRNVSRYSWNDVEGRQEASYSLPRIPFVGLEARF